MTRSPATVGQIVHYVSFGTPGGEYGKDCRAAVVTAVDNESIGVCLAVLNPGGMFFNLNVPYDAGSGTPAAPDCSGLHDRGPHRYCPSCEWTESGFVGGTWHWPERSNTGD